MTFLRSLQVRDSLTEQVNDYPFNLPLLENLTELSFDQPVTFLVGENGSGKSTLLEALALLTRFPVVGSSDAGRDETLTAVRPLTFHLKLVWNQPTRTGFFLRAEDFFGYVKRIAQIKAEAQAELERVDREYEGRSQFAKGLAKMPHANTLHAMNNQYQRDLNAFSHGESFLELFQSRLKPKGVYILDEPEAPLSPSRQLALISLIKMMVAEGCQFIIATHSPILMAFPDAVILSLDDGGTAVPYDTLEHVTLTRSFLNDPEQYLRHL